MKDGSVQNQNEIKFGFMFGNALCLVFSAFRIESVTITTVVIFLKATKGKSQNRISPK